MPLPLLQDDPSTPGMFGTDKSTVYYFDDMPIFVDAPVYYLNTSNYDEGWSAIPGSSIQGMYGRKVWLAGTAPGAGCWFSTDWDVDDLYVLPDGRSSMNNFSTARTAVGPWFEPPIQAPWPPRASAAVLNLNDQVAIVAGGLTFDNGQAMAPTFGDVWSVDVGVCLYATNGIVCGGHGAPDLDLVKCDCDGNWMGDDRCGSCTKGSTYGPNCLSCPINAPGGSPCNAHQGGGYCDPVEGCVCSQGWGGTACSTCAVNYAGPKCEDCAPNHFGFLCATCAKCNPLGGSCDGNGTRIGTGKCICSTGWTGDDCSIPPSGGNNNNPADTGMSSDVAAAVSLSVLTAFGFSAFFAVRHFGSVSGAVTGVSKLAFEGSKSAFSMSKSAVAKLTNGRIGGSYQSLSQSSSLLKTPTSTPSAPAPLSFAAASERLGLTSKSSYGGL